MQGVDTVWCRYHHKEVGLNQWTWRTRTRGTADYFELPLELLPRFNNLGLPIQSVRECGTEPRDSGGDLLPFRLRRFGSPSPRV